VKFRNLSRCEISICAIRNYTIYDWAGFQVSVMGDCIHDLLERRSRAGAIHLVLKGPLRVGRDDPLDSCSKRCWFELEKE